MAILNVLLRVRSSLYERSSSSHASARTLWTVPKVARWARRRSRSRSASLLCVELCPRGKSWRWHAEKREKLAENTTVLPRRLWGASGRRSGEFWRRLRGKDGSRAEALSGGGVCVAAVERRSRREKHERTCLFSSSHLIVKLWVEKTPDSPDRAECVGRFVLCNVQKTRTTRIASATAANTLKSSRKWNDLTVNSNECSCFGFFCIVFFL